VSWRAALLCVAAVFGAVLAIAVFGFGVAPWLILFGAFCVLMMGSMLWMMVATARNAVHRD
jgi:hypothetical protein